MLSGMRAELFFVGYLNLKLAGDLIDPGLCADRVCIAARRAANTNCADHFPYETDRQAAAQRDRAFDLAQSRVCLRPPDKLRRRNAERDRGKCLPLGRVHRVRTRRVVA